MQLFYSTNINGQLITLPEDESHHCIKVLRKMVGDRIHVVDGLGNLYSAEISLAHPKECLLKIHVMENHFEKRNTRIHIAISPTKNQDRIEWFLEKVVEVGVDEISFIQCENSVRRKVKMERCQRIIVSAMKQSIKAYRPTLNAIKKFEDFMGQTNDSEKFIGYLAEEDPQHLGKAAQRNGDYLMCIGPEGDFTHSEIELAKLRGFQCVSLGQSRLRTETAGILSAMILNGINE